MPLSDLGSAQLKQLVTLIRHKERLAKKIASIDAVLGALEKGKPAPTPKKKPSRKRRRKGGSLRESVVAALRGAGKKGLRIKELVALTGGTQGSVSVLVYTSKGKGIKKIAPGVFAYAV